MGPRQHAVFPQRGSATRQSRLRGLQSSSGRTWTPEIPSWTSPPLQRQTNDRAADLTARQAGRANGSDASLEVCCPYSVFPTKSSGLSGRDCQNPPACASRFSQPPDAFIRPLSAGLVPCRYRSWGFALQSITPLVQPYAVSGAAYPLVVGPIASLSNSSSCHRNQPRIKRRKRAASHTDKETATSLGYRVLLHTRVRHGQRRFRPMRARGSLGLLPLQGVHPRMGGLTFIRNLPSRG